MLDFEGNVFEPSRRSNNQVVFENENEDTMYELASTMDSISVSDWEDNIDTHVSTLFDMQISSDQCLNLISDVTFCKSINEMGEISKLSMSIKSFNVSSEPCPVFDIDKTSFYKKEKVKSALKSV